MPFNLLKVYNQLLDIAGMSEVPREASLRGIFDRDIRHNPNFKFRGKPIEPTVKEGEIPMDTLFRHLTTVEVDADNKRREFDYHRSVRLHWLKYHIGEAKKDKMHVFSVKERGAVRTYVYDEAENYAIILEVRRNAQTYFLLTAYHLRGKDLARNDKILKKQKRALPYVH